MIQSADMFASDTHRAYSRGVAIRVDENTGLTSVLDIACFVAGVSKTRAVRELTELFGTYPCLQDRCVKVRFGGGLKTPCTDRETCKLIANILLRKIRMSARHKRNVIAALELEDVEGARLDSNVIKFLSDAFSDLEPEPAFRVGEHRIGLYLRKVGVAIECDEHNRAVYADDAQTREAEISALLQCKWVRFDPYADGFSIGKVAKQVRDAIKTG